MLAGRPHVLDDSGPSYHVEQALPRLFLSSQMSLDGNDLGYNRQLRGKHGFCQTLSRRMALVARVCAPRILDPLLAPPQFRQPPEFSNYEVHKAYVPSFHLFQFFTKLPWVRYGQSRQGPFVASSSLDDNFPHYPPKKKFSFANIVPRQR